MSQTLLIEKKKSKFKDEIGFIELNVLIKYKFSIEEFGVPHLEFDSEKVSNLISETGYRSEFFQSEADLEKYSDVKEIVTAYCLDKTKVKPIFKDAVIDETFILRDDLRDWLFVEDSNGSRYRERIWDKIKEIGVENWFKKKGFPTTPESVWLNRYTKDTTTLKEECKSNIKGDEGLENQGYLLWENWLPVMTEEHLEFVKSVLTKEEYAEEKAKLTESPEIVNKEKNTLREQQVLTPEEIKKAFEMKEYPCEYIPQGIDTEVEKPKTPEELVKERTIELLDKQVRKLQGECRAIQGYFESFLQRHKNKEKNPYYLTKIAEYGFDVSDLNKLKELFEQKAKLYKMCYEKAHFLRWGTNGSEYAYV